jgi:hypothetical protein
VGEVDPLQHVPACCAQGLDGNNGLFLWIIAVKYNMKTRGKSLCSDNTLYTCSYEYYEAYALEGTECWVCLYQLSTIQTGVLR